MVEPEQLVDLYQTIQTMVNSHLQSLDGCDLESQNRQHLTIINQVVLSLSMLVQIPVYDQLLFMISHKPDLYIQQAIEDMRLQTEIVKPCIGKAKIKSLLINGLALNPRFHHLAAAIDDCQDFTSIVAILKILAQNIYPRQLLQVPNYKDLAQQLLPVRQQFLFGLASSELQDDYYYRKTVVQIFEMLTEYLFYKYHSDNCLVLGVDLAQQQEALRVVKETNQYCLNYYLNIFRSFLNAHNDGMIIFNMLLGFCYTAGVSFTLDG